MEVFLHKDEMPKSCVECPFSQRKSAILDNPIVCCISGDYIKYGQYDMYNIMENRHGTCPLKCVEESKEYQSLNKSYNLLDKSISTVYDCFMATADDEE